MEEVLLNQILELEQTLQDQHVEGHIVQPQNTNAVITLQVTIVLPLTVMINKYFPQMRDFLFPFVLGFEAMGFRN
ncbi:hypothetical protein BOQ64_05160 [Chryseobacterium sp. CH25]|nr:hypothetical protein BOQ64_05160 [Chryseobacterium sp. CH25]RXM63385.1 hypothetical protein BOQ60_15520 [Chryseobacterium sp. CH1]